MPRLLLCCCRAPAVAVPRLLRRGYKTMNVTNLQYKHKFNIVGPAGYMLTFHSYGTWLHGDQRGAIDRKGHNVPGTPMLPSNTALMKSEKSLLKQPPVKFTLSQRKSIDHTIREVIAWNKWSLHAINVRTEHIHLIVSTSISPESVMNSLKSWCTRRMRENLLWIREYSPWSRHGSTRYLWDEKEIHDACLYVLYNQDERPLPDGRGTVLPN
jgi:REP element-mobilizing transposase RayT